MRLNLRGLVIRGPIVESQHRLQCVACDADGRIVAATEESALSTSFRSAAKPFQLLPFVERGLAERWRISDEELAVMASSHTGSPAHVRIVRELLDRFGLGVEHLACGYHDPLDPVSRDRVAAHPEERTAIYNNCSGKHAGMLALCLAEGWPLDGYARADHPLQRLMRVTVAEACGVPPESMDVGIDGCSVSVFGLPLLAMARGYARLASADAEGGSRERALARIRDAMRHHPAATGGAERFSTALMEATGGRVLAKGGAEGLECVAMPGPGLGLAVKCEDGAARAVGPAVVALLDHLGALRPADLERLEAARRPRLLNVAGIETGSIEITLEVRAAATTR
jgi:L-asparaginase II